MKKYFYLILLGAVLLSSCNFDKKEPEPVQKEEEKQLYVGEPLEDWVIYYRIGSSSADKMAKFEDDDMANEINEPYKDVIFFDPENADEISLFRILTLHSGQDETFLYLGSRDASKKESDKMHDCHFTLTFPTDTDDVVFEGSGFYDINVRADSLYLYRLEAKHLTLGYINESHLNLGDIILTYNNRKYTVGSRINVLREVYDEEGKFAGKKLKLSYDIDFEGEFKNTIFTYFPLFREFYGLDKDSRRFDEFCKSNNITGIKFYEYNYFYPFDLDIPGDSLWHDERPDHKFDNIYLSLPFTNGYRAYGKVK